MAAGFYDLAAVTYVWVSAVPVAPVAVADTDAPPRSFAAVTKERMFTAKTPPRSFSAVVEKRQ